MRGEAGGCPALVGAPLVFLILESLASSSQKRAVCWFGVKMLQSFRKAAGRAASYGKSFQRGKKRKREIYILVNF